METKEHPPTSYRAIIVVAALVVLAINGAIAGWLLLLTAQRPTASLQLADLVGNVAICPGETLDYRFIVSVSKAASVDLFTSVDGKEPDDHVSYTRLQRFAFDKPIEFEIARHWILPSTYRDPISGAEVSWRPGEYIQRTSASVVGRSDVSIIEVPFSVRSDCATQ